MAEQEQRMDPSTFPPHILAIVDDATQVPPKQGGIGAHPPGKFPAVVTDTEVKTTKDGESWLIKVTFETPAGTIFRNYNRGNKSEAAANIAKGELSALQHAIGRFQASPRDHYAALRGGQCMIEVIPQRNPKEEDKDKGYTELWKVFDVNGNEPGKPVQQTTQAGFVAQPQQTTQAPNPPANTGWATQGATQAAQVDPAPPANNGGWNTGGAPAQAQPNPAPTAGWAKPR